MFFWHTGLLHADCKKTNVLFLDFIWLPKFLFLKMETLLERSTQNFLNCHCLEIPHIHLEIEVHIKRKTKKNPKKCTCKGEGDIIIIKQKYICETYEFGNDEIF